MSCYGRALTGGACELDQGHPGPHQTSYPNGFVNRWTDEGNASYVAGYERRHGSFTYGT